jgi:type II secretion system protein N
MPTINRKNLLIWSGYASFFASCFLIFAYLTFPYDRLRDVLVAKATSASAPGTKLRIGAIGPHWLTGATLTSIHLERPGSAPDEPASTITLDKLTISAAPLSFMFGGTGLRFHAVAGSGSLSGNYTAKKDGPTRVEAELDHLDLGGLALGSMLGVPVAGAASGTVDVTLSDQPSETQGSVDLRIENLRLGDGKAKVKVPGMGGGLTLETVNAGTLELKLSIKEGVATIERMEAKGKDLELSGSGSVRLVRNFGQSLADLTLGVKVEDAYSQRNDRTKAMFELLNASLGRFASSDGMMRFRISGALAFLRAAPAGPSASPPRKGHGSRGKRSE